MDRSGSKIGRRRFLEGLGGIGLASALPCGAVRASQRQPITKAIPKTGEHLPVVGMGTWITFNVGDDQALRDGRQEVLQTFFDRGGAIIDSSPMYGSSEEVIGYCLGRTRNTTALFSATKVWTLFQSRGARQMEDSADLWGLERFDLLQIHNLLDWEVHLETLQEWKADGKVRYIGITTSHGRRHDDFERIMANQPIDFVQFTYNIQDRDAEQRLLPLAAERDIAVIANRPFRRGALFEAVRSHPLPDWSAEIDCENWAQILLKFIVSHPTVTCAIPATSRVDHMLENMGACYGRLPDAALRQRMVNTFANL